MIRFLAILLLAVWLGAQTPDSSTQDGISVRLEGAVTDAGALRATFTVTASGPGSLPYRDAYMATDVPMPSMALFGNFIQNRQFRSTPAVKHAIDADHPIEIQLTVLEDDFMLPVQRQATAQFTLLPALAAPLESDGKLQLGVPGVRREEVVFEIPTNFSVQAEKHVDETRDFARYRSDTTVESGKLILVRELEVTRGDVSAANRPEVEAFWKLVRADQERMLVFRRTARTDLAAWIASVPAKRGNTLGVRALQQREYDAARQLFEKATTADPNDRSAWNNLGRALAALGRLDEAQKAYQRQLAINPLDQYSYNNLGLVQERVGNWGQAIESLRKQLEVHPGDSYAISNLPRALIHEKRWAEAEEAASRATQVQPTNLTHRLNFAIARVCHGTATDARKEIDAALGARPGSGSLNNAAYYLTECESEPALAESYILRALEVVDRSQASSLRGTMSAALAYQNTLSTHLDTYAWLLFKDGQIERALKLFEASLALAPRADVYAHLAEAETKAGRGDQALAHWREATFLEPDLLPHVPVDAAGRLKAIPALSLDQGWYPMNADLPAASPESLRAGQACYFFAIANPDGTVQSVRELDASDPVAKQLVTSIRGLTFRVVQVEATPVPTVHIVKVAKQQDGRLLVARSVSTEAVAIATELAPGEFPLPAPAAPAAPSANNSVYKIGNGVTPPRILSKVEPIYSEEARRAHLVGAVTLSGVVGQDGRIRDLKLTRPLGMGLDENAIQAVRAWRFEPGSKDGQAVNVVSTISVNFRVTEIAWHLGAC